MSAVMERRTGQTRSGDPQQPTRFWWLRHGPVPEAAGGRISGRADLACDLSDQATLAWLRLRVPAEAVFVASPLKRAVTSGEAVMGRAPEAVFPSLMEQDFGTWTGKTWLEISAEAEACGFWDDPAEAVPPDGESFAQQCARVAAFVEMARERWAGKDVLVACHGGTIRAALAHALSGASRQPGVTTQVLSFVIDNLSLTRIDALQEGTAICSVNERYQP